MIANPLSISDIISELGRGGLCIPEIQRAYVWKKPQVAKLMDSLYRGYPTGSLLLWDEIQPGQTKGMATGLGKDARSDFPPKIILDGQQRITSLGRVFDGGTPRQDRIFFNVIEEMFETYSPRTFADPRWIDLTDLLSGEKSELDFIDGLVDSQVFDPADRETKNRIHERLKRAKGICAYKYPVEIVREDDLEIVTEIFIRVNSGGTRLREAELALARLAWKVPGSVLGPFQDLGDECEDRGFDLDSRFFMRALVVLATRQARFKDLKAFWQRPPKEIEGFWVRTEKGIRQALDFVEGNVGIPGSDFLASSFSLFPLVVIFSVRDHLTGAEENTLKRWFLIANSFSRYTGSAETALNQDLTDLGADAKGIDLMHSSLMKSLRAEPKVLPSDLERASVSSPFFPLAYLATVKRGAVDWFKGIRIRRESFSEDQQIEYHHIFPKFHLNAMGVDPHRRDEMANLAFLGQKANRRILKSKPELYLREIAMQDPQRLEAQFVPLDESLWQLHRFDDFLEARRNLLAAAMNDTLEA